MDDFISKQAVIDTIRKIILGFFSEKDGVMTDTEKTLLSVSKAVCNGVRELPPAQPEKHTEERTETHACDCISRQAAIDAVDDVPYIKEHPNEGLLWKAWIEQMPSAQPNIEEDEDIPMEYFENGGI